MSYARPTICVLFLIKGEAFSMAMSCLMLSSMLSSHRQQLETDVGMESTGFTPGRDLPSRNLTKF